MSAPDLIVVGAGTMGAWTALHAQRSGRTVTLVDAYGVGDPRATSGDESRVLRTAYGDDAFYALWARGARDAWLRLGDEVGERFFVEAGVLWLAKREDGFEAASQRTLEALGIPVERLTTGEIDARWPQIATTDLAFGILEPTAGVLLARRGVTAVARRFTEAGGHFELAGVRPSGNADGRRLVEVVGIDGTRYPAGEFVFACGPWLPALFPNVLGDLIRVTKQAVFWVGPPAGDDRFTAEHFPSWADCEAACYGLPGFDGRPPKFASETYGPPFDPTSGERIVDPADRDAIRSYLRTRFPTLTDAPIVETKVCQYESTPDTHFVIDRHPDFDNVWLAGGGSGHGFKLGPMIGEYVLARLDGAEPAAEERRFALDRPRDRDAGLRTCSGTHG